MKKKLLTQLKAYRFRILAGLLFFAFLISTWFVFYQKPEYPEQVHINLQEQLKAIIQEALLQKNPQARNFQFRKMWTQATNKKNQISAHFKYSFDDKEQTNISVEGKALMNRKPLDSSEKYDLWSVDHIEVNNTVLEIQEPITLLSSKFIEENDDSIDEEPGADQSQEVKPKEEQETKETEQKSPEEEKSPEEKTPKQTPDEEKKSTEEEKPEKGKKPTQNTNKSS